VFPRSITALKKTQPVVEYLRPYTPDLVGWFQAYGEGGNTYDANGHYARIQPIFNAFQLREVPTGPTLVPLPVSQRLDGLQQFMLRRCPGSASQIPPDSSAPFRDQSGNLDCDPTQVPPGP
jgi:phospholipid/cholesterol/gamma-HCH transport system substrate-binding protein